MKYYFNVEFTEMASANELLISKDKKMRIGRRAFGLYYPYYLSTKSPALI